MGFPVATRNAFLNTQLDRTLYIALFTIAPDNEGVGGEEVSASGYTRLAFGSWNPAALGVKSNSVLVRWPTTISNWGIVVRAGLYTTLTGSVFIARGDNILNLSIVAGQTPRFNVGELEFSFSNLVD